jgi:hypothetical protein
MPATAAAAIPTVFDMFFIGGFTFSFEEVDA